ncbi:MAG: HAMP domain-containing histidine kinase [Gemmatimonadetes bacterium]|nr:HAMP domain-containing histidine kinase [Gemmatimonadota bacterium]
MKNHQPPRRRTLLIGFAAALIPLAALLGLQYVWLSNLARTTAIAHQASLHHFLESVGGELRYFYRSTAERALNMPASIIYGDHLKSEAAIYWGARPVEGVARLFLVDYSREQYGNYYVFDEELQQLRVPPASEESLAMIAACNPWQALSYWGGRAEAVDPIVDERDPLYRIVLKPITDDAARVVGVTGMILDEKFFRKKLLPHTVEKMLDSFFPDPTNDEVVVTVRDGAGEVVFSTSAGKKPRRTGAAHATEARATEARAAEARAAEAQIVASAADLQHPLADHTAGSGEESGFDPTRPEMEEDILAFPFVFADWSIGLRSLGRTPEEIARDTFLANMSIAALLTLCLGGALLWTYRSTARAVRLSQMKADFVSNVSHELRTPLSSIRVFGEFLKSGRAAEEDTVKRYGRHIEAESRRLSRLIDNVLEFSRIESGSREYNLVEGSLEDVVETAVESFQVRFQDRGFAIRLHGAEPRLKNFPIDPDALGQVLYNLLDNAVKYSGDGREIDVTVSREGDDAVVRVQDRGIGIPKHEQPRIFERFHRVASSLVHDVKGSGLGLSIVESVVQAHGGRVELDSEPGKGTTVSVRLPMEHGPVQ